MENKMKEIAKLLDVELGEEFRIDGEYGKYKLSKNGLKYWSDISEQWFTACWLEELLIGEKKIIKAEPPILDDVEKEYLSAVIKPFRDITRFISKRGYNQTEYIAIYLKHHSGLGETFVLPTFDKGTMYKGMEEDKYYTLDELGL